ncbi:unnamed protein product [Ilex paraguariensis]|uniref:Uncharacterized protein n=1 Tax=Ilex paraguariensis TaxID=185542 RepID=A0ABC8SGF4_9AQUA
MEAYVTLTMLLDKAVTKILQTGLISGDQNGNIRAWDLTANSCSCAGDRYSYKVFDSNMVWKLDRGCKQSWNMLCLAPVVRNANYDQF